MKIEHQAPSTLKNYENNSRTHSDKQIAELVDSISCFGFTNPILVDKDNVIIAGHARLAAANALKLDKVPTIRLTHLTEAKKKAYVIADNKLALSANWNYDVLLSEFNAILAAGLDVGITGFTPDEIAAFTPQIIIDGLTDEDAIPDQVEPVTKLGDVWVLGQHRLMCGDSTILDSVETLMNGEKADMVFTDPPYGIDEKTDRDFLSPTRKCKGGKFEKIIGDTSTQTAIDSFNLCTSLNIPIMIFWGANYYCHSLPESANWLIWDKRVDDHQKDMNSDCELAWVKSKANSVRIFRHLWKGMIKDSENGQKRVHPTQKPIALAEWCFNEYGKNAKTIIDLFGGSGSTLIACEKLNRKCLMMELSTSYCDVIIKRWENFTGKKAHLLSDITAKAANG